MVPPGTVLLPFLFTLYTSDFQYYTSSCHLQTVSEDSSIVGCIRSGDASEYRGLVEVFGMQENLNLHLNMSRRKELVMDFQVVKETARPVTIQRKDVECSPTGIWGSTWTADWTEQIAPMRCTGKAGADSSSCVDSVLSMSAAGY